MNLRELINQESTTIVDVREPYEFEAGHAAGAVNIPLSSIPKLVSEFKTMQKPIIVYCRSGMRSKLAKGVLWSLGVKDVHNGGSLEAVKANQKQRA